MNAITKNEKDDDYIKNEVQNDTYHTVCSKQVPNEIR